MYPKFDPDRPHGIVSPPENGAAFWQNGHHYDTDHNVVDHASGKVLQRAEAAAPPKKKSVEQKRLEQEAKIGGTNNPPTVEETEEDDNTDDNDGDDQKLDLLAWAKGEVQGVQWFKVKAYMAEAGYDPVPAKAEDARAAILAKHGLGGETQG